MTEIEKEVPKIKVSDSNPGIDFLLAAIDVALEFEKNRKVVDDINNATAKNNDDTLRK